MPNVSPVKYATAFTMRADDEFLSALDEIRKAERPEMSRADMLRRLVYDQQRKCRREKQRERT
jgi:hypothetical protein